MRPSAKTSLLVGFILSLVLVRSALAAWPNQPSVNLPVCRAANNQQGPMIVADGAGGAIVTWQDQRGGTWDIFAQHVLASGAVDPAWPSDGRALCTAASDQQSPTIAADGAGGAIVTWQDTRSGTNSDIYAQHVLASGAVDPAWPANGCALCTAAGNQNLPTIVSDGGGGAIVAWHDIRSGNTDIYAQHVLASGVVDPTWTTANGNANGTPLCIATNNQFNPAIVSDGAGGAIVTWEDQRSDTGDLYAQHVLASGIVDPAWTTANGNPNGTLLCNAANDQHSQAIVSDGAGGAIVTWFDPRTFNVFRAYAQHVLTSGVVDPAWTANGTLLFNTGTQFNPTTVSDGAGGAIVTCQDTRGGNNDIYAQHLLASGVVDPAWSASGTLLCNAASDQVNPMIVSDGAGGAIVTWQDARSLNSDIYSQHLLPSGVVDPTWTANGALQSNATNTQTNPAIASDGTAGAIVTWQDARAGNIDIYAQRMARFGYLGTPEAEITSVKDVADDQGGKVKLSWNASYLDVNSDPNLSAYDILRSAPQSAVASARGRGARLVPLGMGVSLPGEMIVTRDGAMTYYWELLASVNALHYVSGYSYLAPTTGDSIGAGNPLTTFMVVARNTADTKFWPSAPATGYSVDNIPPVIPAPFTGNYSASATHLHWNPNADLDLAGYRLYRGSSASFIPGPTNLVAAPTDTGYADAGAAGSYYKLSAVDVHGNQSGFALLTPPQISGTPGSPPQGELTLARPSPNPARVSVALGFSLPRATSASLTIYDAAGRRMRTLMSGEQPAGDRRVIWDLRDDTGHAVPSGLYLVRLLAEGRELKGRLAAMR